MENGEQELLLIAMLEVRQKPQNIDFFSSDTNIGQPF